LKEGPLRYGELRQRIPRLSDKILTERLRDLEECGLVRRRRMPGRSPYLMYKLTSSGQSLRPVLDALYAWGEMAAPTLGVKVEMIARPSHDAGTIPTSANRAVALNERA
jgi:DNA-binding HxlR family transcriptional regulator